MKKQKCIVSALVTVLLLALTGCSGSGVRDMTVLKKNTVKYQTIQPSGTLTPDESELKGWIPAQENDYLALYYSEDTAAIRVFDKRTGGWWSSNPDSKEVSNASSSQLTVSTVTLKGVVKEYSSYFDSLSKGQVAFDNGSSLTITYTFGDVKPDLSSVPARLTDKRFEELQQRVKDAGANEKLLGRRYTQSDEGIWLRKDGLTADQSKKLRELFESIGYTAEELAADNAAAGGGAVQEESTSFSIPLEYTIDGDSLVVRIPGADTVYPTSEIITSLNILEYFGACPKDADGYFLVPNGSGAIVNMSEQSSRSGAYEMKLYGSDYTLPVEKKTGVDMENLLPVFGISRASDGVFAIIEDNDAVASVKVSKAGNIDLWNTVNATFALNAVENIGLSTDAISKFYITSQVQYSGDTTLRYIFLNEENNTYSGMAAVYRDYLDSQYGRTVMTGTEHTPLFVETVGTMEGKTSTLGIVHDHNVALTTFDDDKRILDDLNSAGITNVKLILSGWVNGGVDQQLLNRVNVASELGGKKLKGLIAYAGEKGAGVYPKLLLNTFSSKDSLSNKNRYASTTLGGEKSVMYAFDKLTGTALSTDSRYILSPTYQYDISSNLISKLKNIGIPSVLLGDISTTAYSDYNKKSEALRQYSLLQAAEITALYADEFSDLMLTAPNAGTAPYGRLYTDVPASSGSYMAEDSSVPFYQMIYHGYADYSFTALNFTSDFRTNFLKCVEYGGCLKFRFILEEDADLSPDEEAEEYASQYSRWKEQMHKAYLEYNTLLSPVRTAVMTEHERIADGVYRTDYDNGMSIYVNYNSSPVTVDAVTIPAQQAVRTEGGRQ